MGLGPLVGDAADGGRDLVFVSYSHEDAQWAQRCTVLLKPLVRSKRLRLWVDTDIRTGDEWHPDGWRRCWWVTAYGSRYRSWLRCNGCMTRGGRAR